MNTITRRSLLVTGAAVGIAAVTPRLALASATSPIIWVHAHPDDETFMGVSIIKHPMAGQDVHLLTCTDGEGANILTVLNGTVACGWCGYTHDPATQGYAPLDGAAMAVARIRELNAAVGALGAGLPGKIYVHRAMLPDGGLTSATVQAQIIALADELAPGGGAVRLKGHTWSSTMEAHPDHLAVGAAIKALVASNPGRFADGGAGARYYVEPPYWSNTPPAGVTTSWDTPGTDATITGRALGAAYAYRAWAPLEGHFACGYHSVAVSHFAPYTATPKCRYHA